MVNCFSILGQGGFWVINKKLANATSISSAILLADLASKREYFLMNKDITLESGWFFNTQENIQIDTSLSPHEQRKAFEPLIEKGFLEVKKMGIPAKNYFKLNDDKLLKFLTTGGENFERLDAKKFNDIYNNNKYNKNKEKKINIISEFDKQIRAEGKQFFLNCYQSKTGSEFYWEGKDAVALIKLLDKIKTKVREKFPEIENESAEFKEKLASGFEIILTNIKDKWILDNYSLPLINSKFNEIYSQITTKKHDTNNLTDLINFAVGANQ